MSQTILLTGISGFIAKRIARDLLEAGHSVVGSVRSLSREAEVRAAVSTPQTDAQLRFVALDLGSDEGWDAAMEGVDAVLHTASPFPMSNPKDENDLIRPAVDGTLRALKAAQAAGVTRVVLTSSMVAIMSVDRPKGHLYGADDWTDTNHPTAAAYVKSKTLAERAAWDFVAAHPEMQLTTVNPGLVVGTPMDSNYGTSLELIERMLTKGDPAVPDLMLPIVDIADVSRLHVEALSRPETIGKRMVAADTAMRMADVAQVLKDAYPDRKISAKTAPKWLLRLLGFFDPAIKSILPSIGFQTPIDNSQTKSAFGMEFTPAKEAILASARAILSK